MTSARGTALAEVLVAAALGGLAVAALTLAVVSTTHGLRLATETSLALTLATERLEMLRLAPAPDGHDAPAVGGLSFDRSWATITGRGAPDALSVVVRRGGIIRATLSTEVTR